MIAHISGILEAIEKDSVIVDVNGIGYKVHLPAPLLSEIGKPGDRVKIFTEHIVREDSESLYGFRNKEEKNLFNALLGVSGIGPKSAMSLVSGLPMDKLVAGISQGNSALIASIPGIGTKTAQRIIVELKEKIGKTYGIKPSELAAGVPGEETLISDAISALITLGYSPKEARESILKSGVDPSKCGGIEELIKGALKRLS